jgi:hypothetical protein
MVGTDGFFVVRSQVERTDMTLDELAEAIRKNEQNISLTLRTSLHHAAQSGLWLLEAKSLLPHGEWEPWVEKLGKPGHSTCRRYMQIAKDPDRASKVKTIKEFTQYSHDVDKAIHKEQRAGAIAEAKRLMVPNEDNWQVHHADNRKFDFPMVDHIFTDPPWPQNKSNYAELSHYVCVLYLALIAF